VYDGEQLIAFSFFDLGQQSISSIIGIYDEKYSRHSLGIYTMLAEVQFAIDSNIKYYYPGFVFNKPSPFDYKLRLGEFQTYDWKKGSWVKADKLETESFSGKVIIENLAHLEQLLHSNKIKYQKKIYPYFSLGYIDSRIEPFVKAPVLLLLSVPAPEHWAVVEYLPDDKVYMLSVIECCSTFDYILDQQEHMGSNRHKGELKKVYKYNELLAMSADPKRIIQEIIIHLSRLQNI
jgi:arginine-tRNA-protein transferase